MTLVRLWFISIIGKTLALNSKSEVRIPRGLDQPWEYNALRESLSPSWPTANGGSPFARVNFISEKIPVYVRSTAESGLMHCSNARPLRAKSGHPSIRCITSKVILKIGRSQVVGDTKTPVTVNSGRCLIDPGAVAIEDRQQRVLALRGARGKLLQGRRADEKWSLHWLIVSPKADCIARGVVKTWGVGKSDRHLNYRLGTQYNWLRPQQ